MNKYEKRRKIIGKRWMELGNGGIGWKMAEQVGNGGFVKMAQKIEIGKWLMELENHRKMAVEVAQFFAIFSLQ